jgi:2-haloalkanoic acid dehalogenase type II
MTAEFQPEIPVHRIRAITLDLDNTLWDINPVIRNAEAKLWAWLSENYPLIPDRFDATDMVELRNSVIDQYRHKSHDFRYLRKKVLKRVAIEAGYDDALVEPAFQVFDDARNSVELYADVLPDLEYLYEKFTIIAVTNGNANLQTIGIDHLFHGVVTAVDAGVAKPARPIFDAAVARAGVAPEEILHVGDHPETDIDGANKAGMRTAWINRTDEEWPVHLDKPDVVITTITELRVLLEDAS